MAQNVEIKVKQAEKKFTLRGYDSFSSEWYPLPGKFTTEPQALRAAQKVLKELERTQPSSSSGGQSGIQDQVFVVKPDGDLIRIRP